MSEAVANVDQLHEDEGFWDRFRSRPRVLARWFHESREKWKRKYQELKRQLKRLQVQVADVRNSREKWKEQAQQKGTELAQMKAEVERLQRQLEESEIKILPPTLSRTS
jgi:peptidoglycan hydrolase CwlO-like protein